MGNKVIDLTQRIAERDGYSDFEECYCITAYDLTLLDNSVSLDEQEIMIEMGFCGEFLGFRDFPCENKYEPYIDVNEVKTFDDLYHVQCPLYRDRCGEISEIMSDESKPCEILFRKILAFLHGYL